MQLQAAHEAFQVQLVADGRSEHTRRQYRRHVAGLIAWLTRTDRPTTANAITPQVVAEFFASDDAKTSCRGGPKKATSANAQRTSLRCFLRWLHESGTTATNAGRLLRRARCAPPPPKALHADEQQRLREVLAAATGTETDRDRVLVELLLGTGIRIGSALGLDVEDIDLVHGELTLRTSKNDRPAVAVLPKEIAEMLRVFVGDQTTGPLFVVGDRRLSMRHAQRRIGRWLTAAGIRGRSAHALRHSFATRIYSTTGDLQLTQAALGHASVTSTVVYARLDRARLRAAVGA